MIIGVCVKFGDHIEVRLPKPNRHCNCFWHLGELVGDTNDWIDKLKTGGENQGFYTHTGRYLNRKEALKYVKRIKQPVIGKPKHYLFSEDLW